MAQQGDKINVNTVLVVAGGLIGFTMVTKLLAQFGLWTGPGGQATQQEQANPNSPWKPAFYKSSPAGSYLLTVDTATAFSKTIHNAFTVFNDDFNAIMSVFSALKTKSQLSFLSDVFQQRYNEDLLSFLKDGGGILPWDGLSDTHLKVLTDLVNHLPQYKP